MRRGEAPLPDDARVLRGGLLTNEAELREDARFNFEVYGFYGLSMWSATPEHTEDTILATKLRRFPQVTCFTAGDLYAHELQLWDTGAAPHYDVVYVTATDLDQLIAGLVAARHVVLTNDHHDPEGE